ncbi:DUF3558 domain-containing protein [Skermania sp. ID1734]|uniref:DUF3558 domain-containing protein n=1 Tax=Skermania sp. ID1734 TaxID=2597516 RepID=UPI0011803ABD|nr:DUF3558 domain-containing protein [Skermania sp. ID1734]TSD95071.1 DUF3558 domain-containing protein [Skermania sp. ID1734]
MRARIAVCAAVVVAVGALAGCSQTVTGTAMPAGSANPGGGKFRDLLHECDAVSDDQIAKTVGADSIERGFFGAICRWDATGPSGEVKVTFNWFETGSLEVERATLQKLHYGMKDITVQGRKAIQEQPPNDPDSCGVTAGAADTGIIGWWVQYRPGSTHPDPCQAAQKLAELTLNLSR